MGQGEILEILEEHGELSTQELQKLSRVGKASINTVLRKLLEQGLIQKRKRKKERMTWVRENYYKLK